MKKRKKIGLALGSGSFRGFAHVGVIKALIDNNIPIDYLAGTSIGAIVASFYALNKLDNFEQFITTANWKKFFSMLDITLTGGGLIDGKKAIQVIHKWLGDANIEDTKIPLTINSTNVLTGEEVRFTTGDIKQAIRASFSLPGIFTPAKINDNYFVDGGLVNPIPISTVRDMGADIVIAVNLNHDLIYERSFAKKLNKNKIHISKRKAISSSLSGNHTYTKLILKKWLTKKNKPSIIDVLHSTMQIFIYQITEQNLKLHPPDFIIKPKLGNQGHLDFKKGQIAIDEGYNQTLKVIPEIKKVIK